MNREIKFRAWHIGAVAMTDWENLNSFKYALKNENIIVMQYTELKDHNGNEIYDGDILLYEFDNELEYLKVEYYKDGYYSTGDATLLSEDLESHDWKITVAGNIYQNPELSK